MNLKIYSVYDSKAQAYLPMFTVRSHGEAVRQFTDLANNKQTAVNKYPEDFSLMELGSFDDNTGTIDALDAPKNLGLAREYIIPDLPAVETVQGLSVAKEEKANEE